MPIVSDYFRRPLANPVWILPSIVVEEIAWRGYLQTRLVRQYGLFRGLFLLGVVWGAFHFSWDFHISMDFQHIISKIILRLASTVAISLALGWLTIQSQSIVPAVLCYWLYDVWVGQNSPAVYTAPWWVLIVFWAAAGIFLFRVFPPVDPDKSVIQTPKSPAESAPEAI